VLCLQMQFSPGLRRNAEAAKLRFDALPPLPAMNTIERLSRARRSTCRMRSMACKSTSIRSRCNNANDRPQVEASTPGPRPTVPSRDS
jgi:hypothetical protein